MEAVDKLKTRLANQRMFTRSAPGGGWNGDEDGGGIIEVELRAPPGRSW